MAADTLFNTNKYFEVLLCMLSLQNNTQKYLVDTMYRGMIGVNKR